MNQVFASIINSFAIVIISISAHAAHRDDQWKKVEEALQNGLPKTAITNLEPIIAGALKDRAYGEAAKAIARKVVLQGNIQGNKPEEKIRLMEAEIATAPKEIVPLLQTIQANWYWHYFQNNRWRFMRRTATAEPPGKDFTTWDLRRLFAEIDRVFARALSAADQLKQMPVSAFDALLQKGTVPDTCRPTLYDFVAHEALKFYTSGEQAAAKPEDAYDLPADGPIFESAQKFMQWGRTLAVKEFPDSPIIKALNLYGELLTFHEKDQDPGAFIDTDLARLVYGYNVAVGESKNARCKAALKALVDKWADHEVSALALYHWARVVREEGDLVEARRLAQRGKNAHGSSIGGKMCHNLIAEIEAKSASISTERVWNGFAVPSSGSAVRENDGAAPDRLKAGLRTPTITVRYRNLTNVYFRAVAYDWSIFLDKNRRRPEYLSDKERKEVLAKAPALEWSVKLAPTTDFKERIQELPAPDKLKPGFYFLVASHDPSFGEKDNQVSYTDIWVSDLALILRPREERIEGFVLQANSGEPIAGAEIMAWYLDRNGNRVPEPKAATDENGFFSISPIQQHGYLFRARHNGQEIGSAQEYQAAWPHETQARPETVLFTDRAIYRPGQTIQYKGICLQVDSEHDNYKLLPGRELTVIFFDPNNKEIARHQHRCNDYGSFGGSFVAPRDRLTGFMMIRVHDNSGAARFSVEEYKRPKFQVTLQPPKTAAKLNDKVSLAGKAESYTGAAVDGAKVRWRVAREVRWPVWSDWFGWRRRGSRTLGDQEIAHGTARTDADGAFKIEFIAKPDPQVSEKDEVSFGYAVDADVTDSAGETRSASHWLNVGFTALQAILSADEWQSEDKPVELRIATTTLDNEPLTAEGSVKVFRLKAPPQVQRAPLRESQWDLDEDDDGQPDADLSNPNNWELANVVAEHGFATDAEGKTTLQFKLGPGAYRAVLETQDRFGKKVTARLPLQVLKPSDTKLDIRIPHLLAAPKWVAEPGEEFMALWGTGYDQGRAFIEIEHRHKMIEQFWTKPGQTQQQIRRVVTEAMRGGLFVHVTQVRENRAYLSSRRVDVPWSNKDLEIKWEHFTSKLAPGQKETWTGVVSGRARGPRAPGGAPTRQTPVVSNYVERAVAELVATLYDESLDAYRRHYWPQRFNVFRSDYFPASASFVNHVKRFQHMKGAWDSKRVSADLRYRQFPADLVTGYWGYGFPVRAGLAGRPTAIAGQARETFFSAMPAMAAPSPTAAFKGATVSYDERSFFAGDAAGGALSMEVVDKAYGLGAVSKERLGPDLSQVTARKNLNETAFFFPQLVSDSNGVVRLTFTMPEALTAWRFLGFAHDKELRSGYLEGHTVTAKDLMVQPNPPRFLREGDTLEFTVKVSNQTAARQEGRVGLSFFSALNDEPVDALLGVEALGALPLRGTANAKPAKAGTPSAEVAFDIPAKESRSYAWRITVPDGAPFLTYKAVGSTGRVSDGEEGYLPVLSRRMLVTESLPLPIRGPATNKFQFAKLLQSGQSDTLRHQGLTVQAVSNPAWYAVMALPYLMEFPHECTEQVFNRLYANVLARHIANSDPKIRRIFDQWKGTPALDSPLEKNQELKAVMIEETPWLRQAQNESQARKNVGALFDNNRLNYETERTLQKLAEMQLADGSWPWFLGGRGNDYITLYITTGFGRLRHLGADLAMQGAAKSLSRLDDWLDEHYREIMKRSEPREYVPSSIDALYLYGRSFFLKDTPIAPNHKKAVEFFLQQSRQHWLKTTSRQTQGHLALALKRFNAFNGGNDSTPADIMRSIKERSVTNQELGMFWRDAELSWWWYHAPIETQALMIEAFDEVMGDAQAVEDCRVWLLKQKQTQDWKTTKATADAVYALLLRGKDWLASDKLIEMILGGINVTPGTAGPKRLDSEIRNQPEPGTGFYEFRFASADIKPELGQITVKKADSGVAWGSVHWQYLEDVSKITAHEGTPLKLNKTLYTKVNTAKGPVLEPVRGPVNVGDELVVRLELRVDRDMEYVHLKDQRGSGTEPMNVLSRYKYQDGLAYYESTRDTASHFFIDYLPKGAYVFEYSTRVQHRGVYQTGLASLQCMYAPEFNSHSTSFTLRVK